MNEQAAARPAFDQHAMREDIRRHLIYTIGKDERSAEIADWRVALSRVIRDRIVDPWFETTRRVYAEDRKRVYYLSMEYLIGRLLSDATTNMGLEDIARSALADLGVDYTAVVVDEPDAALGNGGLGRLAACFLDSLSTIGVAAYGYGIRYEHGLFKQQFRDGEQVEIAEDWLTEVHPWEFERRESAYPIGFGGTVHDGEGGRAKWEPGETVVAAAYDTPVPGWRGRWANTLRLWSAKPTTVFDLEPFNRGDYLGAARPAVLAQTISRVLYPDDTTPAGKELRLKQEYFFTAASLRDLVRRFLATHDDLGLLPQKVAIQLNDTHPAIAAPELIRILLDEHGMPFDQAFGIARATLNYTNHTLLPEALERWPVDLMRYVLPRHMALIERIDDFHIKSLKATGRKRPDGVRIIEHDQVRMGDLAFIAANKVNGVSALHTELMKETVFRDLHTLHPDKIVNQTNGVTPRRWLYGCNPALSQLITDAIGENWVDHLENLERLAPLGDDADFRRRFDAAKQTNKDRLVAALSQTTGLTLNAEAMFDNQIKRIHEYKRQLMNILETVALYNAIKAAPDADWTPRVKIFGGKAAPGYHMAKAIVRLINDVAAVINADPTMRGRLAVAYPANYNVSMAELLIPAADLSEQISTAGMEASGTGNMKFALNGALTLGTLDGANVEIRDHVGDDNIFIFGLKANEVASLRAGGHEPRQNIESNERLSAVLGQIASGAFSPDDPHRYQHLVGNLYDHDWFMVTADFDAYWKAQRAIDAAYRDRDAWVRSAILNTAHMGYFSSDRTIRGYAREVWDVDPVF